MDLIDQLISTDYFQQKQQEIERAHLTVFSGLVGSSRALLLATLWRKNSRLLVVTASLSGAERLAGEIEIFSGRRPQIFPPLDNLPGILPSKEVIAERLKVGSILNSKEEFLILTTPTALNQKTMLSPPLIIRRGESWRLDRLIEKLLEFGYQRFEIVGEKGEFSVRGGVVDIFPVNAALPVRLEFFEDQIVSVRTFATFDQRSVERVDLCQLLPASEKGERWLSELLPPRTPILLNEPLEFSQDNPLPKGLPIAAKLTVFLEEGENSPFLPIEDYRGRLNEIPSRALIVSRHVPRLLEENPAGRIIFGELGGGFSLGEELVISDRELFGEAVSRRRKKPVVNEGVAEALLADLRPGDLVVHENYGLASYLGLTELKIDQFNQEYLLLEFAGGDKLYLPPAMFGLVEKYRGVGGKNPRLSRLGGGEWKRTRQKVKKAVEDMSRELLQIYAARQKLAGYAFPPDDLWQKELEATFPFEETADQQKAIAAVKRDMEAPRPMDRLICGDVGYGKTEVAIRAAAKAAAAGKQVGVLAPTTILAEQHYNNFLQRFKNTPFIVGMLSRFSSVAEQKETVKALAEGGIDVVIGTHRLLSKDVRFRDLGLLIIDEEHKFGVGHKEKLKKIRANVDVITLTATPIPRTLYFSLAGIREMSLIATPPVDRSPVKTYVLPYDDETIRQAVLRELDRGGQVYFLHNYVETILGVAARLQRLVPQARIAVVHGQLPARELEKTMLNFMKGEYDVLVCTAIIESGIDIPSVNTLLIDQADRLGLAQLYQIRGRVGRSAVRAYAYLFYQPAKSLSDEALERLRAIQEFAALGSGYQLAMRDLEIRGSGNLLGAEQSGHIYEVGFDLYCELLEEAVREAKGEKVLPPRDVEIDLQVEARLPASYVPDERQRLALYRRLNMIDQREQVVEIRKELIDRFGPLPAEASVLLQVVDLRVAALGVGVKSIKERDGRLRIEWWSKKRKEVLLAGKDRFKLARREIG